MKLLTAFAVVFLCLTSPVFGQTTFGSITGTVTDPTGAVIPGAAVSVTNAGTGIERKVITSAGGVVDVETDPATGDAFPLILKTQRIAPGAQIWLFLAFFLAFAIMQQGLSLATQYTAAQVGWLTTNRLRADLVLHILRLDMPFHKSHTPGELIDRADGDVTQLSNFLSMFTINVVGNGLLVLGILVLLFRENTWIGAGMLAYTLLTLLVLRSIQRLAATRWVAERQSGAKLYGFIEERISGAEEIRAAGAEAYVMSRLYEHMRDFTRKTRTAAVYSQLTYHLTNLVYVLGYAAGLEALLNGGEHVLIALAELPDHDTAQALIFRIAGFSGNGLRIVVADEAGRVNVIQPGHL